MIFEIVMHFLQEATLQLFFKQLAHDDSHSIYQTSKLLSCCL